MPEEDRLQQAWAVVELAEAQEGLVRREQLVALGLDKDAIGLRLADARLHRKHRGVYTVGHRLLRPEGEWVAAVWAVPGCVLSHQSAAAFHGWMANPAGQQHVTTINEATSRPGLTVHRMARLYAVDVARHPLLAVTTPARTIVDLASVLTWPELRGVADRVRLLDVAAIRQAQGRATDRRGAVKLRRLCERLEAHTKSEFERRFLRFCRRHGVPLPDAVNARVGGVLVDCRYAAQRVVVELDSRAFHARQGEMREDRRRDRKLLREGVVTVRLVWEDLDDDAAAATVEDLLALLVA
ncbi:MAG: hypothetical protein JWO90_1856 [Solirubrobacterales bacterium]|jgi:very-short-patch-repair endonuclease|nr:hypothetical protein [Solirubrobacterales bacterium]